MNRSKSNFIHIILFTTMLLLSACSTIHKVEGLSDYSQVVLQIGDKVKAEMKDETNIELKIKNFDAEYFYGKGNQKIKRDEIKSLEFSRFDPGTFYTALFGFFIFAIMFSG